MSLRGTIAAQMTSFLDPYVAKQVSHAMGKLENSGYKEYVTSSAA